MKKGKLFLTATLSFVVAGGAFAFKAHRGDSNNIYQCNANRCELTPYTTEEPGIPVVLPLGAYFIGGQQGGFCTNSCGIKLPYQATAYIAD